MSVRLGPAVAALLPDLSVQLRMQLTVSAVVGLGLVATALGLVGPRGIRATLRAWRRRLLDRLPAVALLLAFMAVMRVAQPLGTELSWLIGVNITDLLYAIEGDVVPTIQSYATPPVTAYLAFVYVFGFAYLLAVPYVLYTALPDPRPFRETVVAYVGNYLGGLLGYTLFISYGPRNYLPDVVDSILFSNWPSVFLFTAPLTSTSNVFPSLHTSFSVTVALLAWRTREEYPRWALFSPVVAGSVVVATMYLGIHWATDVVAGLALAVVSVRVARRDPLAGRGEWVRRAGGRAIDGAAAALDSVRS
ncbi:MAG: phosphatase PAP2 family protein [Halobacteriaceae archaeon]